MTITTHQKRNSRRSSGCKPAVQRHIKRSQPWNRQNNYRWIFLQPSWPTWCKYKKIRRGLAWRCVGNGKPARFGIRFARQSPLFSWFVTLRLSSVPKLEEAFRVQWWNWVGLKWRRQVNDNSLLWRIKIILVILIMKTCVEKPSIQKEYKNFDKEL